MTDTIPEVNWSDLGSIACASVLYSKYAGESHKPYTRVSHWLTSKFMDLVGRGLESEQGEYESQRKKFDGKSFDYLEERLRGF
ncbi:MAG: hypothetical protein AABW46_00240 [Nanoarchaeota archaeon]